MSTARLEAGLDVIRAAPTRSGTVELIVRRPATDEREVLDAADLDPEVGLVGDGWRARGSRRTPDGAPNPDQQLTLMSARAIALMAEVPERWAFAGDQLYVDLDLSAANLPPGTRLSVGSAVVEVNGHPHTGCAKFAEHFGADALRFVNAPVGRELRLRGVNARVVVAGTVRTGDPVVRLA